MLLGSENFSGKLLETHKFLLSQMTEQNFTVFHSSVDQQNEDSSK